MSTDRRGSGNDVEIGFQIPRRQKDSRINAPEVTVPRVVGPVRLGPAPVVALFVYEGVAYKRAP